MQNNWDKGLWILLLATGLSFSGCKSDNAEKGYDIPATYSFSNVDLDEQLEQMEMATAIEEYMDGVKTGTQLDAQKLKNMFANINAPFAEADLNTAEESLKDKTFIGASGDLEQYMDSLAAISGSTSPGAPGKAGMVQSLDGSKTYLLSAHGIDYIELIEKSIMGAVFYYQGTGPYMSDEEVGDAVDNETEVEGKGTALAHHWDEAFGYLGMPVQYPQAKEQLQWWGNYIEEMNPALQNAQTLFDAFIKGRAAIENNDLTTKNEMRRIIKEEWERICAGVAIHYLNKGLSNFSDDALRCHALSEGLGFATALFYNPDRKITDADYQKVLAAFGHDFYAVKAADLAEARDLLSTIYGFDNIKAQL